LQTLRNRDVHWNLDKPTSSAASSLHFDFQAEATHLKNDFPDISGFSLRNLKYMRQFAERLPDANWAAAAAQIPWATTCSSWTKSNLL